MSSIGDLRKQSQRKRNFGECAEINDSPKKRKYIWNTVHKEDFDDIYNEWFANTSTHKQNDDYQIYGKLLINKLKTYSACERKILMLKIDKLLIENPPGFDKSSKASEVKKSLKNNASSSSVNQYPSNLDKDLISQSKKNNFEQALSQTFQITTQNESAYINATEVNLMQSASKITNDISIQTVTDSSQIMNQPDIVTNNINKHPAKSKSNIQYQPIKVTTCMSSIQNRPVKVTGSILNQPVNVLGSIPNQLIKVTSSIPNQPINVICSIPNQPVKVINSFPNKAVKIPNITSQQIALDASSSSVPLHLPLHITIPENIHFTQFTHSNYVVSSSHPKGKIVIRKSKSAKHQCQPPILITVPSLNTLVPASLLSSIAVDYASQVKQNQLSCDIEGNVKADDVNVVA